MVPACRAIAFRMEAGMSTINDFATTYMCQSLPFGGVKYSGFDRFGGECVQPNYLLAAMMTQGCQTVKLAPQNLCPLD